ncbi:non-specific serine,threonine protein kinase [Sarracenia purpurea var. burkii]
MPLTYRSLHIRWFCSTEAAARLGQLMMEDLVPMNMDFRQFYGPRDSCFPEWMRWEELEMLPAALKERACGRDG